MSIFTKIEGEAKTLAHDVEDTLAKLYISEPKVEAVVATTITVVSPLIVAVTAATEPLAVPEVTAILTVVQSDLAAAQVIVTSAGATPTVKSLLTAVVTNLKSILSISAIKDAKTSSTITTDVDTIAAALQVIVAAL
jgi:hypothetical protein